MSHTLDKRPIAAAFACIVRRAIIPKPQIGVELGADIPLLMERKVLLRNTKSLPVVVRVVRVETACQPVIQVPFDLHTV